MAQFGDQISVTDAIVIMNTDATRALAMLPRPPRIQLPPVRLRVDDRM
jgi:hypothetical protein